jgi:hypothetical protein
MEQSPWEAKTASSHPNIRRILGDQNVYRSFHKSQPFVRILNRMDPFHTLPPSS